MSELPMGYPTAMSEHPHQPESDEADPEKQSTPAGVVRDLEEAADDAGATVDDPAISSDDPAVSGEKDDD